MQLTTGTDVTELRADDGAAASDLLLQFQANICGLPVMRNRIPHPKDEKDGCAMASTSYFNGFSHDTISFLSGLRANNDKAWFDEHRADYEECLLEPMKDLVTDLGDFMLGEIDPGLDTAPMVNHTISRIRRDTRFSKDKSPYRSVMWFTFKRPVAEWKDRPAFYFEISPEAYRWGMGFYTASRQTMDAFREWIDEDEERFLRIIAPIVECGDFAIEGEMYRRPLAPDRRPEIRTWYDRKNLYIERKNDVGGDDMTLFSRALVSELEEGFRRLAPLYQALWRVCSLSKVGW